MRATAHALRSWAERGVSRYRAGSSKWGPSSRLAPWLLPACAAGLLACTPAGSEFPARPSLLEPSAPLESEASPGEWRYHPRKPARLTRSYPLQGGTLFVGELGERWLVEDQAQRATPASALAPEPLMGALERASRWSFVGRSGTTYEAESPLGALLSATAPLERLARVDVGERTLVATSHLGRLLLSEDAGGSWRAVGPTHARFADVLIEAPHALALEVPERLWWSPDEGRSWQVLDAPPVGAQALQRDAEAGPVVVSVLGIHAPRFQAAAHLQALGRNLMRAQPELGVLPREGPSGKALDQGRAFVSGGQYFEVELGVRAESVSGAFAGALQRRPTPEFSACQELRVAGFGIWAYAACTRERAGPVRSFEFFRSEDSGRSFEREPYRARGSPDHLRLAVGAGGELLVTGTCPAQEDAAGCRPHGIQHRRTRDGDAGSNVSLHDVPAPALEEHAQGLIFSADGRRAYAVGRRTKNEALFIFVARDLETGFDARPIVGDASSSSATTTSVRALTAARDGQLSVVLGSSSGQEEIVLLDPSGHTLARNDAPIESASIGVYGARALAVSFDQAWESLNGGAEWESVGRLPRSVCHNLRGRCAAAVVCHAGGCALGDALSRVGWRGQARQSASLLPPAWRGGQGRRSVAKPLYCELSDAEWRLLRGVERMPDASQAALGKAAWYALASDDATAAAGLWVAELDRSAPMASTSVRYSELLAPSERAADTAYQATLQVEGAAALRYLLPGAGGSAKNRLTNVQIAWENLLEGRRGRGIIRDAGGLMPGDFAKGDGAARRAQADLLSITSGGLYARMHRHPQHNQTTYYLDGEGTREIPPLIWSPAPPKGASSEMARADGQHLALLFLNQGATLVRASLRSGSWQFDAMTIGFPEPEEFGWRQHRDIVYLNGGPGIHVSLLGPAAHSAGQVFPLQARGAVFGAPVAVPTQAHLSDPAPLCSAAERAKTPRVIAAHQIGSRHPVLVHDAVEPQRPFLTDFAVLHGTVDAPCLEVFDAEAVRVAALSAPARERALVNPRGPSWLFRLSSEGPRRDPRVEYRRMQCRVDGGLDVPPEVFEMQGTHLQD